MKNEELREWIERNKIKAKNDDELLKWTGYANGTREEKLRRGKIGRKRGEKRMTKTTMAELRKEILEGRCGERKRRSPEIERVTGENTARTVAGERKKGKHKSWVCIDTWSFDMQYPAKENQSYCYLQIIHIV